MRIGVISDLHATVAALAAVLRDLDDRSVDQIVCLGDVVDMGPSPNEVIDLISARGIPCISGNHDRLSEHPGHPLLAEIEAWTLDRLSPQNLAWLAALPAERMFDAGGVRLLCVHGSPHADTDQVTEHTSWPQLEAWWGERQFDVMVCGHTHVQLARRAGSHTIVNVGSVAQPFERPFDGKPPRVLPACDYAIVEGSAAGASVELRRIPLPWEAFVSELRSAAFPQPDTWLAQWRRTGQGAA